MKRSSKSKAKTDSYKPPDLHCKFCGKTQHEVDKMIAGPSVFICDECTVLCMDIILGSMPPMPKAKRDEITKKLNFFTTLLCDKYEPIINELIEKGDSASVEEIFRKFLSNQVESHNRFAEFMDREPINTELLKFSLDNDAEFASEKQK